MIGADGRVFQGISFMCIVNRNNNWFKRISHAPSHLTLGESLLLVAMNDLMGASSSSVNSRMAENVLLTTGMYLESPTPK